MRGIEGQDRVLGKKGAAGLNRERKKQKFVEKWDTEVTIDGSFIKNEERLDDEMGTDERRKQEILLDIGMNWRRGD